MEGKMGLGRGNALGHRVMEALMLPLDSSEGRRAALGRILT